MQIDHCFLPSNKSKIKLSENGRSAVFLNPALGSGLLPVKVDGCAITSGDRADFAIENGRRAIIVELKGRSVEIAANQIRSTAAHWRNVLGRADQVAGLIVARQYPRSSSTIQLKQQKFADEFGTPLHVVCSNEEYEFDAVFQFQSPLKKGLSKNSEPPGEHAPKKKRKPRAC